MDDNEDEENGCRGNNGELGGGSRVWKLGDAEAKGGGGGGNLDSKDKRQLLKDHLEPNDMEATNNAEDQR